MADAPSTALAPTATTVAPAADTVAPVATPTPAAEALIDDELLVEEISIDGMCGVY